MDRSLDVGVGRCARWSVYGISIQGGEPPKPMVDVFVHRRLLFCVEKKESAFDFLAKGTVIVKFQVLVNQD